MKISIKPLVTISMMTYNQEKYVRDAVRGVLSQTYEPLEIVISDDHSTDRTWDIINEEVEAYKKAGGIHKNIILNRNEKNLGIAMHAQKAASFKHGEIIVGNGGDDISLPNRVEKIVKEWMADGGIADVIMHGAYYINLENQIFGKVHPRNVSEPLGAAMAWRREGRSVSWPPVTEKGAYEDRIAMQRAIMLNARVLSIPDALIYYRYGSGVSSSLDNHRVAEIKSETGIMLSWRQTLVDLHSVGYRFMTDEQFRTTELRINTEIGLCEARIRLYKSKKIAERFSAYREVRIRPLFSKAGLFQLAYLLPSNIADAVLDTYKKLKIRLGQWRFHAIVPDAYQQSHGFDWENRKC